jgi:hypothetical protein
MTWAFLTEAEKARVASHERVMKFGQLGPAHSGSGTVNPTFSPHVLR